MCNSTNGSSSETSPQPGDWFNIESVDPHSVAAVYAAIAAELFREDGLPELQAILDDPKELINAQVWAMMRRPDISIPVTDHDTARLYMATQNVRRVRMRGSGRQSLEEDRANRTLASNFFGPYPDAPWRDVRVACAYYREYMDRILLPAATATPPLTVHQLLTEEFGKSFGYQPPDSLETREILNMLRRHVDGWPVRITRS